MEQAMVQDGSPAKGRHTDDDKEDDDDGQFGHEDDFYQDFHREKRNLKHERQVGRRNART